MWERINWTDVLLGLLAIAGMIAVTEFMIYQTFVLGR